MHYFKERKVQIQKDLFVQFNWRKVPLMITNQPTDISDKLEVLLSQQKRGRSIETGIAEQCRTNETSGTRLRLTLMQEYWCQTDLVEYRGKCLCRTNFFSGIPAFRLLRYILFHHRGLVLYQHDWLHLQSINSDNTFRKVPLQDNFLMTTFCFGVYIVNKSMYAPIRHDFSVQPEIISIPGNS